MSDAKRNMKEGRWAPDECPITGKPFFLWLSHPEFGYVPTYGGPFDSFMIAEPDEDGYYRAEHYCHDRGDWIEGGTPVTVRKELTVTAEIEIAPTQGADARPIYQVEQAPGRWTNVSRETFDAWAFGKQIVYATRDAEASDGQDAERYRWLRDVSVPPHNFYMSVPEEFKDVKYSKADVDREIDKAIAAIAPREKT